MFGRAFFGGRYFGPRYWGDGDEPFVGTATCFFTNFEDSTIGDDPPSGWTMRGGGTHSLTVAYDSGEPIFKERVATLVNASNEENTVFSVDAVDGSTDRADADVVVCVYRHPIDAPERFVVHVRGQGSGTVTDGYQFAIDFPNARVRIYKLVGGVKTNPFSDLTSIIHPLGEWMMYRFRVNGSGTVTLEANIWFPGTDEPAFALSVSDSSSPITAAGWIGVGGYVSGGAATSYLNFFSLRTGGDSAHVPVLNDEYDDWLDNPNERRCLIEMAATGYDAAGADASPQTPTKTVYAYVCNGDEGYTSGDCDDPPLQYYAPWITRIPTFRREMSAALVGRAATGFGSFLVANPAEGEGESGVRDNWVRMKWKRDYITPLFGDPSWHKFNFRPLLKGRLQQPVKGNGSIEFPIEDLMALLQEPLQTERYDDTAAFPNTLKPMLAGNVRVMEPVPTGATTSYGPELQFNDGPVEAISDVIDGPAGLSAAGLVVDSVAGNVITSTADHGMVTGYGFRFNSGTPPSPLALSTDYYAIVTGPDTFKAEMTPGSGEIALLSASAGAGFDIFGWQRHDLANGKITLATQAVGRVVGYQVQTRSDAPFAYFPNLVEEFIFDRFGLSPDFKDEESFTQALLDITNTTGLAIFDEQITALDWLDRLSQGNRAWYGFSPTGRLQIGALKLPTGNPVMEFDEGDVKAGSMTLQRVILPVNPATLAARWSKAFLRGGALDVPPNQTAYLSNVFTPYFVEVGEAAGIGVPLDSYPEGSDVQDMPPLELLFNDNFPGLASALQSFYGKKLGVYSAQFRLRAMRLSLGQEMRLAHARLQWKAWDAYDPASPDNTDDVDSTLAIVLGLDVNPSATDPFPVRLTMLRPIPGHYPEENLN